MNEFHKIKHYFVMKYSNLCLKQLTKLISNGTKCNLRVSMIVYLDF